MAAITLAWSNQSYLDGRDAPGQVQTAVSIPALRPIRIENGRAYIATTGATDAGKGRVDGIVLGSGNNNANDWAQYAPRGAILRNIVASNETVGTYAYLKSDGTLDDNKQTGGYFTIVGMFIAPKDLLIMPVFDGYKA